MVSNHWYIVSPVLDTGFSMMLNFVLSLRHEHNLNYVINDTTVGEQLHSCIDL